MSLAANKHSYFVNLDATRFLGFIHVFLAHCFFTTSSAIKESATFHFANVSIKAGFLGLDYFFVLSAFLLTWLALDERHKTGQFHATFFMIRRGIRLWPLYFLLVLGVYFIHDVCFRKCSPQPCFR
jgi:peptidoglycan/LPS O-acetylase OafA/YrhL